MSIMKKLLNFGRAKQDEESPDLWAFFRGVENSREVLIEKAAFLAPILLHVSLLDSEQIRKEAKKTYKLTFNVEDNSRLILELILFYLHYMDRAVFAALGPQFRNYFVDVLIIEVREHFFRKCDSGAGDFRLREQFINIYNERHLEYSKYKKECPEKGEGYGGTLFWEMSERAANTIGHPRDPILITLIMISIMTSLATYNFTGIINAN